jgi:cytochrome c
MPATVDFDVRASMSGDLQLNKIMGAGLAVALGILGVRELSTRLFDTEQPERPGYAVAVQIAEEGGAGQAELPPDWGTVLVSADLAAGEAQFRKCVACHVATPDNTNKIGPGVYGVVGGAVAARPGFAYSEGLLAHKARAPTWTYDELDQFLKAPARYVPGTKMSFAGLRNQEDRVNIIAWLRQQGSSGYPIPAPDPSRQPGAAVEPGAPGPNSAGATQPGATLSASEGGGPAGGAPVVGTGAAPVAIVPSPGGDQGTKGPGAVAPGNTAVTTQRTDQPQSPPAKK